MVSQRLGFGGALSGPSEYLTSRAYISRASHHWIECRLTTLARSPVFVCQGNARQRSGRSLGVGKCHSLVVVGFKVPAGHEESGDPVAHPGTQLLGGPRTHVVPTPIGITLESDRCHSDYKAESVRR